MDNTMLKRYLALAVSGASLAITAISALSPTYANSISISPELTVTRQVQLNCVATFVKEFTQVPFITNSTQKDIPAGTTLYWQAYWAGNPTSTKGQLVLSQPLKPGASISTQYQLSGDNNSCKAYY
ncbi:hypothetical protein NIES2101_13330 [Calothrix sp. HK-06]|nr:hypothetical protein NIES2101_13330 [Calothrix sp. HK-06]